MTLTEFLLARFMDDEERCVFAPVGKYRMERLDGREEKREADAQRMMDYVHRFQPDWVVDDIHAKRRIVDLAREARETDGAGYATADAYMRDVLRLLALPYAEHPDYRDEWKP